MSAIRVMIADDQEVAYTGMKEMVERTEDLTVVAIATTPSEVIKFVEQHCPDVILLDLLWKREEIGPELCQEIVTRFPATKVVAFSQYVHLLSAARTRGAVRTLHKDATKEELWEAIRWAAGSSPTRTIPSELQFEPLTPRELEVLQGVKNGGTRVCMQSRRTRL